MTYLDSFLQELPQLSGNIGNAAIAVIAYSMLLRYRVPSRTSHVLAGVMFGLASILALSSPIRVSPDMFFDFRNLFVVLPAAFAGPLAGAISLVIGLGYRATLDQGVTFIGEAMLLTSMLMALLWRARVSQLPWPIWTQLAALGVMAGSSALLMLLAPFGPPVFDAATEARRILPLDILGIMLFGGLLMREDWLLRREHELRELAHSDPLTGLLNRRGLVTRFERRRTESEGRAIGFVVLDLNDFKQINDRFGHRLGDRSLMLVAQAMRSVARQGDVLARTGGDEFALIFFGIREEAMDWVALRIAERLQALHQQSDLPDEIQPQASFGMHYVTVEERQTLGDPTLDQCLQAADAKMYREKRDLAAGRIVPVIKRPRIKESAA